jgi:hypothetical protein
MSVATSGMAGFATRYPPRSPAIERFFENDPSTKANGESGRIGGTTEPSYAKKRYGSSLSRNSGRSRVALTRLTSSANAVSVCCE